MFAFIIFLVLVAYIYNLKKVEDKPAFNKRKSNFNKIETFSSPNNKNIHNEIDNTENETTINKFAEDFVKKCLIMPNPSVNSKPNIHKTPNVSYVSKYHKLYDFTAIDFETANNNPDSACSVAITIVEKNIIIKSLCWYINPPYDDFIHTDIHGITKNDVKNEPSFDKIWPEIKPHIENKYIVAYNAPFDTRCLEACLNRYNIPSVGYAVSDVLAVARSSIESPNYKLLTIAKKLKIPHNPHDAESDANACASILIKLNQQESNYNVTYKMNDENRIRLISNNTTFLGAHYTVSEALNIYGSTDINDYTFLFPGLESQLNCSENNLKARALKAYGLIYERCDLLENAYQYFVDANTLFPKVGVTSKIKLLEKKLK